MKISTKGRYALRLMLDLAEHRSDGFVSLKDIAERQGISKKYLEQIIPMLNTPELLRTNRGFQGGYCLAQPPEYYSVGMILRLTEGSLAPVACVEEDGALCDRLDDCATILVWKKLNEAISSVVDHVTLEDLIDWHDARNGNDYVI